MADLGKFNPQEQVDAVLQEYPEADGFLPMMGGDLDMTVLLSNKEQKILKVVDLRPWLPIIFGSKSENLFSP